MKRTIILAMAVMFMTTGLYAAVSDHVLKIELATTYEYGAPGDLLYYVFDAGIQIDETIVSGTMQDPNGDVHPLVLEEDDSERWLSFCQESPDLAGLDDFLYGTFTFTVEYSDTSSESTSIDYAMGNGDPISPVTQQPQSSYPLHNSTDVLLATTLQFDAATNPDWDITLEWEPEPDGTPGLAGGVENLSYDTTSYGPVILSPDTLYSVGIAINNAIETVNADGIPAVMDMDAECHILFTTASESSSYLFWPIEVGQTWTYQATDNDANSWTMTYEIDGKTSYNGKEYFHLTARNFNNDGASSSHLVRVTDEGLYTLNDDLITETMDFLLSPLGTITRNFDAGESLWEYRLTDRYETVSLGSLGTFEALVFHKYPSDDDGSSGYPPINRTVYYEEFIVPGFGMVKMIDTWFDLPSSPPPSYAPVTYVLTDISPSEDFCGILGRPFPEGDLNYDCHVNFKDFALFAGHWLECTDPCCP